ncbi:MAG: diguanylate cyclase [Deltaproteobacteria bacterium]|nr:diguanylate cyclase [Deltaproteobacteria bacterium]
MKGLAGSITFGLLVLAGLYLTSRYEYVLFHSLAELLSVALAFGVFMLTWDSRRFLENHYLLFVGIAFLFVASLDVLHILAGKDMYSFRIYDVNLEAQLWIAARFIQGLAFAGAAFFIGRKLNVLAAMAGWFLLTLLFLLSIFYWRNFPVCCDEVLGLTPFAVVGDFIVVAVSLFAAAALWRNRQHFERRVFLLILASIIIFGIMESVFPPYRGVAGLVSFLGHYLKIISLYLVYQAILAIDLGKPYEILFRNLRNSENLYRTLAGNIPNGMVMLFDRTGRIVLAEGLGLKVLPFNQDELIGKSIADAVPGEAGESLARYGKEAFAGRENIFEFSLADRFYIGHVLPIRNERGEIVTGMGMTQDITERKRLENELKIMADTDKLTGSCNRQKFEGVLLSEMERSKRYKIRLSMIMFDIDHFKRVNDTYGHQRGDSVLQEISRLVRENIRRTDHFCRWGGEEFIVLSPETSLVNAMGVAEKLRILIAGYPFEGIPRQTVSFGVAQFRPDDTLGSFVKRADEALYRAKGKGRNRVESE